MIASALLQEKENYTLIRRPPAATSRTSTPSNWGPFAAGVLLAAIPPMLLFLALQRFIVEGLTSGVGEGMSEALTGTPPARVVTALSEPHHDGSEVYVTDVPDELGGDAVVRLRVPHGAGVDAVALRSVPDGETRIAAAEVDEETPAETWWRATLPLWNPETRYRWLVRGESGHAWVNGQGVVRHDVADDDDFVLDVDRGGPDWHLSAVVYEIFPDRFAPSELESRATRLGGAPGVGRACPPDGGPTRRGSGSAATSRDRTAPRPRRVVRRLRCST